MKRVPPQLIVFLVPVLAGVLLVGCDGGDDDVAPAGTTAEPTAGERAGQTVENAMERTGNALERGASDAGQAVGTAVDKTSEAVREGANHVGDALDRGAERTGSVMEDAGQRLQRESTTTATRPTTLPVD
jgi:hypothetical protein